MGCGEEERHLEMAQPKKKKKSRLPKFTLVLLAIAAGTLEVAVSVATRKYFLIQNWLDIVHFTFATLNPL